MKTKIAVTLRYSQEVRDRLAEEPIGTRTALISRLLSAGIADKRHLSVRQLPRGRGAICQTTMLLDRELARPLYSLISRHMFSPLVEILLREHYGMPKASRLLKTSNENNEIQSEGEAK